MNSIKRGPARQCVVLVNNLPVRFHLNLSGKSCYECVTLEEATRFGSADDACKMARDFGITKLSALYPRVKREEVMA